MLTTSRDGPDTQRGFGASLASGDLGSGGPWQDLAVGSPRADAELDDATGTPTQFTDIGFVEVFRGSAPQAPLLPPFDESPGAQVVYVPAAVQREDNLSFGQSLATGRFTAGSPLDLAIGAPGGTSGGSVGLGTDVRAAPASEDFRDVDMTVVQGVATVEDVQLTIEAQDSAGEAGDRYGFSLDRVPTPPFWSPKLSWDPLTVGGSSRELLVVGAPGEDLNGQVDVGTACVADLSGAAGPAEAQWCLDPLLAAGLNHASNLEFGFSVAGAQLSPHPMGHETTYDSFQVVVGAPGHIDGGGTVVGAVGQTYLAKRGGALTEPYNVDPLLGDATFPAVTGNLRFGSAIHLMDVNRGGQGQVDVVAGAPDAAAGRGGFAWTHATFSSPPVFPPSYYLWEHSAGEFGWPGDSMEMFIIQLQDLTTMGFAFWSETNHGWATSLVDTPGCFETPVNIVNLTPEMNTYIPQASGFSSTSTVLDDCGGVAGAWTGHTLRPYQACEEEPDPGFVSVGDPWPRQVYGFDPHDSCGDSKERVMFPLTSVEPFAPQYIRTMDMTEILEESFGEYFPNLQSAIFTLTVTPGSGGPPPTEATLTVDIDIVPEPDADVEINNADPEGLFWTLELQQDEWVCE